MINEGNTPPISTTPNTFAPPAPVAPPVAPVIPPATTPDTPPVTTTPPAVTPVTPPATPPTPPATPAPIDTTKIEEKVSKGLLAKIADAWNLTKKEEEAIPTDPEGLKKYIDDITDKKLKAVADEREKKATQSQADQEKQLAAGAKNFQNMWVRDYNEMAKLNRVPAIVNATDKNDPGNIAKTKILFKLSEVLKENEAAGIDYVPSMWEIIARFPNVLRTETTAGATAPVSGGGSNPSANANQDYQRMHNTPIETMVANKAKT